MYEKNLKQQHSININKKILKTPVSVVPYSPIKNQFYSAALTLIFALSLSSCASMNNFQPSQAELEKENFGTNGCPDDYKEQIKKSMSRILKDPSSAKYQFSNCKKGRLFVGWLNGGSMYGYLAKALINAKNSFGGYTGNSKYYFIFQNGKIKRWNKPDQTTFDHLEWEE